MGETNFLNSEPERKRQTEVVVQKFSDKRKKINTSRLEFVLHQVKKCLVPQAKVSIVQQVQGKY